jgi:PiT family inorganic phosphate transporter
MLDDIRDHHAENDPEAVEAFLAQFEAADVNTKGEMLRSMKAEAAADRLLGKQERRGLGRVHRVELVKRNLLLRIAAAWIITVPVAAILAAVFFFMIRGMLLP